MGNDNCRGLISASKKTSELHYHRVYYRRADLQVYYIYYIYLYFYYLYLYIYIYVLIFLLFIFTYLYFCRCIIFAMLLLWVLYYNYIIFDILCKMKTTHSFPRFAMENFSSKRLHLYLLLKIFY